MTPSPKMRSDEVQVIHADDSCPIIPIVDGRGEARALIWPGSGARQRSLHRIVLGAGAATIRLQHPMEAAYYVVRGSGVVADDAGAAQDLREGSMIHVNDGSAYRIRAGGEGMEVIGGPCPADKTWYADLAKGA